MPDEQGSRYTVAHIPGIAVMMHQKIHWITITTFFNIVYAPGAIEKTLPDVTVAHRKYRRPGIVN